MNLRKNLQDIHGLALALLPVHVCAQLAYVTNNGAITITQYTGPAGAVIIAGSTNGMAVTAIGDSAFYAKLSVTSVMNRRKQIKQAPGSFDSGITASHHHER